MPVFLSQSDLGRGDLRLFLTNENGYRTDPFSVKWTIFSDNGKRVSGNRLPASRAQTGEYYAPWNGCAPHGCYEIVWEYKLQSGCSEQSVRESFFVIEHSKFQCCGGSVCPSALPDPCCNTYMIGGVLGRGDLCLFLKDGNGIPLDAYSVTWQIYDANGCAVTPWYDATQTVAGEYYASWFVNVLGGNYSIHWKVIGDSGSPAELFKQNFSVLSPTVDICMSKGNLAPVPTDPNSACLIPCAKTLMSCGYRAQILHSAPCSNPSPQVPPVSTDKCCPFEIPRVIHLTEQNLPIGGAYTNQSAYFIPSRIRNITFYIKYRRNQTGGQSCFKLLWSNGTEETQSTLIDLAYSDINDLNASQDMYLNSFKSPIPQDESFINFHIETSVPAGASSVRLLTAECGQPTQPGIIAITLTAAT